MASSSNGISTSISSSPLSFLRTLWTSTIVPIFRDPGSLRLLVTVLSTSLLTGAGLLSFQTLQRQTQRKELRDSIEARFADADGDDDARRNRRRSLLRRRRRASSPSNSVKRPNGIHIHGDGFEDDASDDSNGDGDEDEDEELEDYTMTPTTARREMQRARSALADMAAEEEQQTSTGRQPRTPGNGNSAQKKVIDQEIIDEALARNLAFLGPEALAKVRDSFVVVVGLGGVGSAAANMLVRSGVGKIRLIDFDQVSLSSLNRHSVAELSDVGTSKVKCCASRFSAIAPWVDVEPVNQLFSLADADELLAGRPDWVVDCIDNIGTKVELLAYCRKHDIKVFSAMGAGGKYDTTRVQISDISATHEDPLARSVRIRLKKEGITHGVPVVYSTEVPHAAGKLLPLPEDEFQKGNVGELHALEAFRVRILPVLGPLPCMFGQAAAGYIVASLAGNLQLNPLAIKNRHKVYTRMYQDLLAREQRRTGDVRIPISEADVCYLFEDLHRGRSVTCPLNAICAKPTLIRWDAGGAVSVDNLVVMDRGEADRHDREVLHGDKTAAELWGEETVALVEKRRMLERENRDYRLL